MRVLLLATDAYGGHGGIALYNRDVADALATQDAIREIVVIPRTLPLPPDGIPKRVTFVPRAARGKLAYVAAALRAATGRFDLLICGHIHLLPLAVLLNLKLRAPLALVVYGIDVWRACGALARRCLSRVTAVWSISAITRERMIAWSGLPSSSFVLLPNAVHLDRYGLAEPRVDLLQRYRLAGRKVLMTLARLPSFERYKGVDEVLDVLPTLLPEVPSLVYLIAGEGDDRKRLERKVHALGMGNHVVFTGFVPEADKADLLRLADAFVMPGRGEGFGFVFLEALACGIPAVGSIADGSREALLEGELGELVDPSDADSIRAGILAALSRPKGIPKRLSHFAWPRFVERLGGAIDNLVSPQKQTAR